MRYLLTISIFFFACNKEADLPKAELNSCNLGVVRNLPPLRLVTTGKIQENIERLLTKNYGVILLDFDGERVTNTNWTFTGEPFECAPAGLSIEQIKTIVDDNTARFAPFKIRVTTSERIFNQAPKGKRKRVILTTSYQWYGNAAGGTSYTGSIRWADDTPCFVFTQLLGYNTKNISIASTHEAGHTLGLRHQASWSSDCILLNAYNYGDATLAPIMGVAYYAARADWWIGPNSFGCNNIQDDKQIIASIFNYKN